MVASTAALSTDSKLSMSIKLNTTISDGIGFETISAIKCSICTTEN
jgi:hypothetical protein